MTDLEILQRRKEKWDILRKYMYDDTHNLGMGYLYIIFSPDLSSRNWREKAYGTEDKQKEIWDFILQDEVVWCAMSQYEFEAKANFQKMVDKKKIDDWGFNSDRTQRLDYVFVRDFYKPMRRLENLFAEALEKCMPDENIKEDVDNYVSW